MAKQAEKKGPQKKMSQAQSVKKWKGKDWFDIMTPPEFGSKVIYQTPSTDPASLIGRNINVPVSEVTGERSKYFVWLKFKIADVKGSNAQTIPNGMQCMNEYLSRIVRKRKDKIEITHVVKTKDGWEIRIKPLLIMTRNVSSAVRSEIINNTKKFIDDKIKKMTFNDLMQEVIKGSFQMKMKKQLNKVYPVKFSEIGRIKVIEPSENAMTPALEKAMEKAEEPEKTETVAAPEKSE
ncbi:MAG: hypothetical protein JW716_00550 [Candidatus Aenigmarchaeota archaeon]|nr:hypothetical protein [Candidatus Aenigmarchaeota archaeon]